MKTGGYTIKGIDDSYSKDRGNPAVFGALADIRDLSRDEALTAAAGDFKPSQNRRLRLKQIAEQKANRSVRQTQTKQKREREKDNDLYKPGHQPRDAAGKFRQVLARLKEGLGEKENVKIAEQIEAADMYSQLGDYKQARDAGNNILELIEKVDEGTIKKGGIENLRDTSKELGRLMSYLPMPQGDSSAKIRFSDIPGPAAMTIKNLIAQVEARLSDKDEADKYTEKLRNFMAGVFTMSADEIASQLALLIRVLA